MNRFSRLIFGVFILALTACTPMIYGVPQTSWDQMSEAERIRTMDGYNQRQIARQHAAAERSRQRALQLEEQRRQEAIAAENQRRQIKAIYRGDGNYGDLLHVRLENGTANFHGQIRQYNPVSFQIAKGEVKNIIIASPKRRTIDLDAYYDGINLYLDANDNTGRALRTEIPYDQRWSRGHTYSSIYTNNRAKLKAVNITVKVVDTNRRHRPAVHAPVRHIDQPINRVIIRDNRHEYSNRQNQQWEQRERLNNERRAIEEQRRALKHEQKQFEAEQQRLKKERKSIAEEQSRIKKLKDETARKKKKATRRELEAEQQNAQSLKEQINAALEKEKQLKKKEQNLRKKEKSSKQKHQQLIHKDKTLQKEQEKLEKEMEKEEKQEIK